MIGPQWFRDLRVLLSEILKSLRYISDIVASTQFNQYQPYVRVASAPATSITGTVTTVATTNIGTALYTVQGEPSRIITCVSPMQSIAHGQFIQRAL